MELIFENAAVPAGEHSVRITVKDADGRESNAGCYISS